jgi:hypothetical protein
MPKRADISSILIIGAFSSASWPGSTRPSTSPDPRDSVDARIKSGHDGIGERKDRA